MLCPTYIPCDQSHPFSKRCHLLSLYVPSWLSPCPWSMLEELCPLPPSPKGARHTKALQASVGYLRHPEVSSHCCKVFTPCPTSHALPCSNSSNRTSDALSCIVLAQPDYDIVSMVTHRCARALKAQCQQSISIVCTP